MITLSYVAGNALLGRKVTRVYTQTEWRRLVKLLDERDRLDLEAKRESGDLDVGSVDHNGWRLALDSAIERLEAGKDTICSGCGGEIAEDRLDSLPTTSVCESCTD